MHKIHTQPGFSPDSAKGTRKSLNMTSLILQPDEMLSEGQGMRECVRASGGGCFCIKVKGMTVGTGAELVSFSLGRDSRSCRLPHCLSLPTHVLLVQAVCRPGTSIASSAAHDAAVISEETGSISFTASSITSMTWAMTSAHFPDGFSSSG